MTDIDSYYVSITLIWKGDQYEICFIRYFTAVATGSFREAFRRIHVAKPPISQTVVDLEEELGLRLFSRVRRIAELTPAVEMFYAEPYARSRRPNWLWR